MADNNGVLQFNGKTTSKSIKILSPKEQAKMGHAKRTQKQIELFLEIYKDMVDYIKKLEKMQ